MMAVNSLTPNIPRFDILQKKAAQHSTYVKHVSDNAHQLHLSCAVNIPWQWLLSKNFKSYVSVRMQL